MSAALATNSLSVLTHQDRCRCKQMPSLRNTRQTACTEPCNRSATASPSQLAWPKGGRFFQQRQDSISKRVVVHALRTRTRHVVQAPQPVTYKPLSPFDDGVWPGMAFPCYLLDTLACKTTQDYSSSFYHLFGFGPATRQLVQFLSVFGTTSNCGRNPRHAPHHTRYRSSVQVSTSLAKLAKVVKLSS